MAAIDAKGINVVEMFYDQYGDSAGMDQEAIEKGGEKYLASKWPKLDIIKSASIVGGEVFSVTPTRPASKPAVPQAQPIFVRIPPGLGPMGLSGGRVAK